MAKKKYFEYQGYKIPMHLVDMTGGGADTWHDISQYHLNMYKKYCPIKKTDTVFEMGSGVGRDAMQLKKILGKKGKYIGADIIRDSIIWCQQNITSEYPNFEFMYLDIESQIHNPHGKQKTTDISLPIPSHSVDKIVLHSVFTHMFEDDITHYLKEFHRLLKPDGVILTSFFYLTEPTLERARLSGGPLTFEHSYSDNCLVNDKEHPEGAVGYFAPAIRRMLTRSSLVLRDPIHLGFWSGAQGASNGQDVFMLKPASRPIARLRALKKLQTTLE